MRMSEQDDDKTQLSGVSFIEIRWEVQDLFMPESGRWRRTLTVVDITPEQMIRAVNAAIEQFRITLKAAP